MSKLAKILGVKFCNGCNHEFTDNDLEKIGQWFRSNYIPTKRLVDLVWCNGKGNLIYGWLSDKQADTSWAEYHIAMTREEYEQ